LRLSFHDQRVLTADPPGGLRRASARHIRNVEV
jgi:hypothetical protein